MMTHYFVMTSSLRIKIYKLTNLVILKSIKLSSITLSLYTQFIIKLVENQTLRYWFAPKLKVRLTDSKFDFFGYDGKLAEFFMNIDLSFNLYMITFQCCCCISEKRLDLSSTYNFKDGCQKSID